MSSIDLIPADGTGSELKRILDIDLSVLESLADRFSQADVGSNAPEAITSMIDEAISDPALSYLLEKHIMAMATVSRRQRATATETIQSLIAVSVDSSWSSDQLTGWEELTPIFSKLIESKVVSIAEKAVSLYYDHERLWISGTLVTDMRPVFDEHRLEIVAGVVTHSLKIFFRDDSGTPSEFVVALDLDDIESLIQVCEEAKSKAIAATNKFKNGGDMPVIQFGGNE